jgi:hypothetical protein
MRPIPVLLAIAAIAGGGANALAWEPAWAPAFESVVAAPLRVQNPTPGPSEPKKPVAPVNTIAEVFAALEACWIPPPLEQARAGMQITVLVSFKRNGEILGKPRITYETPGASDEERLAYRVAMAQALSRCAPLPFTDALGGALAGRLLTIRFIDNRKLKQAGTAHDRERREQAHPGDHQRHGPDRAAA